MSSGSGASSSHHEHGHIMEDVKVDQDSGIVGSCSKLGNVLRKDENFKKFDIVEDISDHHYAARRPASMLQPMKTWARKIREEWRILNKDLPDTIFVRVYESRMDLLRAVIMGAEGTPYHDGLFFFDVCFPSNYPFSPPEVYYHSGGLRINPNLYHSGKVCLSLLHTWRGFGNEKWIPGSSTILQVLVSIQGLILNAKPYFNEPGFAQLRGSVSGEKMSMQYNERTLVLSLKTMVYIMKKPPKHFEGFVIAHFRDRAHAILMSGKAYCKGVRVGCVVDKGEGRSRRFKSDVEQCMKMLAREFEQIGVKGMEEFKRGDVDDSLTRKIRAFFCISDGYVSGSLSITVDLLSKRFENGILRKLSLMIVKKIQVRCGKRVFPGSSSSMEAKLEVSSPPVNRNLKRKKMSKQNEGGISSALGGIVELDSDAGVSNSYDRKDYMDFYADDYIYKDEDEDAILKSYFDNIDLPTGVEASLPGFYDSIKMKNKMTSAVQDTFSSNGFMQSTHPDYARLNLSSMGSPNLDTASHKHNVERLPLRLSGERTKGEHATVGFSSSACPSLQLRRDAKKVKHVKGSLEAGDHRMSSGSGASSSHNTWLSAVAVYPQVVDPKVEVNEFVDVPEDGEIVSMEDAMLDQDPGVAGSSSSMGNLGNDDDDVLRKDQKFKKFDIVKDHSCHHYAAQNSSMMQPSKNWAKKIQEEWRILKKDLPDMIFVRVYESRMDLLTAVIIGAEGTPYHDGLFFFDACFPCNYPDAPPELYYHSGGIRINPNLYHNGKVCLSLLNTWHGASNEKWIPGASTMLQVLVSIQGLILNAKPYFNEPIVANSSGSVDEEKRSLQYNKHILILSLRTMAYTMKHPPKHFEDLVIEHFRDRAHAILMACKAYRKGVRVGCVADDKGKDKQEGYSWVFRSDVERCMKMLVEEFKKIGVKDMEESMSFTQKIRAFFGF
ncbi:uncharacterized protein LOC112500439 [Cynara cardunculus var. scolymus]|uniref:uncharacterized protein LOC112500439 n=1 Tax=Cynara cardunculus var. scolymus TaxID=59895 RepID=UPI000D631248|nr:uncharacterized protein LOC112500439 [Cynara cardunculus var. scolymus]